MLINSLQYPCIKCECGYLLVHLPQGLGLADGKNIILACFLMTLQFIFVLCSLVCMKGDCHLCIVDECQWFGQINLQHSWEPEGIAGAELTFWYNIDINYNLTPFPGLEDHTWIILCQVEYQLYFLLIMESRNKFIDLFPYISVYVSDV